MNRRVVITGMGAITPLGNDLQTSWDGVTNGHSGIGNISLFDASTFPVKIAGEVKNFSPDFHSIPEDYTRLLGRSAQLCLHASQMAIDDSGIDLQAEEPQRIGVSLGADEEYLHFQMIEEIYPKGSVYNAYKGGDDKSIEALLSKSSFLGKIWSFRKKADIGAKILSLLSGIQGPIETTHTACSSSGHAIGRAKKFIEDGDCDIVIAGGHCSMISEFVVAGFYLLGTLSTNNDDPPRSSRPFDCKRDGFVISEGSGVLILEEASHAKKRGAHIYAELSGYGSSSNAYRITDSPPDGRGGDLAMKRALENAKKNIDQIDYINAHGTGTLLNDRSETLSIKNVFGDRAYTVPISSSKSMLGHLVTSSSAVELILCTMAINNSIIPPTINLETPDPQCDLDYVPNQARQQQVNCALSNSFAFGGQNATLIVEKFNG